MIRQNRGRYVIYIHIELNDKSKYLIMQGATPYSLKMNEKSIEMKIKVNSTAIGEVYEDDSVDCPRKYLNEAHRDRFVA